MESMSTSTIYLATKNRILAPIPQTGLTQYTGPWGRSEVVHLLKRTMFGARKQDVDYFTTKTLSQSVDELLTPLATQPAPPINHYTINDGIIDPDVTSGQTWIDAMPGDNEYYRLISFQYWWMGLMFNQNRSIAEKMTFFWHNHFSASVFSSGYGRIAYLNNKIYREGGLGNFKNLVKKTTIDPVMLYYLNGQYNSVNGPDENYARELQELFTLGVGAGYTENDVQEMARVLTGFRVKENAINASVPNYFFDDTEHDTEPKSFSSFYANTVIAGQTGQNGQNELDSLLNMIFAKQEVANFICRKIYRFFVYYKIDATIEANVIVPLANTFRAANYEIIPVLKQLFKSEHFFDMLNRGACIKSPIDHVIGLCREFNTVMPPASDFEKYYRYFGHLAYEANSMELELGNPPNVAGWPAWHQSPQYHELWISGPTLQKRNIFTDDMITNGYRFYYDTFPDLVFIIDPIEYTKTLTSPSNPNLLIDESLSLLYSISITAEQKAFLKEILLTGQANDNYWTNAWNSYIANPTDMARKEVVESRLRNLYKYLMNISEYHLM